MSREGIVEHQEYWTLPLNGSSVTRCSVDRAIVLDFLERESELTMRIEEKILLREHDKVQILSPEEPTKICPLFSILRKSVISALAYKSGKLEVQFENDILLSVEPDSQYEAWQVIEVRGFMIISLPGGGLAVWL